MMLARLVHLFHKQSKFCVADSCLQVGVRPIEMDRVGAINLEPRIDEYMGSGPTVPIDICL